MYLSPNMKRNLVIGGLAILALIIVGSVIGTIISLIFVVIKGIVAAVVGLIGFAFKSVFNLLLVAGLGYLAYRWYQGRRQAIRSPYDESERRLRW
jgi:membrane protein implicated in regulation of membrane protease activity